MTIGPLVQIVPDPERNAQFTEFETCNSTTSTCSRCKLVLLVEHNAQWIATSGFLGVLAISRLLYMRLDPNRDNMSGKKKKNIAESLPAGPPFNQSTPHGLLSFIELLRS